MPTGPRDLRPYQAEGFSWLMTLHTHGLGGNLGDDIRLGKTVQSLALICHVWQHNPWHTIVTSGDAGPCGGQLGRRGRTLRS